MTWRFNMQHPAVAIVPHAQFHDTQQIISMATQTQSSQVITTTSTQIQEAHSTTNHATSQAVNAATVQLQEGDGVSEQDKRAIYKHPLFPLMALLFEKCEQATQTPECPSSDSFDVDIQTFVHHQEQDRKPFFSDDPELDSLMVKAIQVLRIHLLELEKVNDLCKDFCNRYINCLKGKLQSDNLLRIDGQTDGSPLLQSNQINTNSAGGVVLQQNQSQPAISMATLNQGQIVSGGTVYQMVQTPQGLVAQPIQIQSQQVPSTQSNNSHIVHGSTPLSQIGIPSTPVSATNPPVTSPTLPMTPSSPDFDDDDYLDKKKNKRGVLPKHATQIMKSWLFQHIVHPYPTEDEKRQIASQTHLSLLQVNNWFINARRRILQPMLDSSNPDQAKVKKTKPQNRPVQRFWPDNIATLAAQTMQNQERTEQSQSSQSTESSPQTTATARPSQAQPIILPPGTIMTADGQLISTASTATTAAAVNLHLTSLIGQHQANSILMSSADATATAVLANQNTQNTTLNISQLNTAANQTNYSDTSSSE